MMQPWFSDAKLGIFIHYGIYAVKGIPESWSFFSGQISYPDYMSQLEGFTAEHYDPQSWAKLFKKVGARYAVMTAKHHDGVALWDTQANDLSVVKRTQAGRDLLRPYVEALREHDLKVGIYFSHLDWSHPDYPTILPDREDAEIAGNANYYKNRFAFPEPDKQDPERWKNFIRFHRAQMEELSTQYGTIDLYWFDGEWERTPEQFDMAGLRRQLEAWQPNAIFNSRLLGHGDYATPEQGVPIVPPEGPWEFCVTINDSWGYQVQDHNHKSVRQLVRMFAETIGMGGNMLLDIGPHADGTLQSAQVERLEGLGAWIEKHAKAIYPTGAGLPAGLFYGASTLSRDGKSLFLFAFDPPMDEIAVKGLLSPVKSATVVGKELTLAHRKIGGLGETPGVVWIEVPTEATDPNATVIRLDFDEPVRIYQGSGRR
ncbi:MAG: alpha-L-fucosidase [Fimbriimonadaceae bacterium]|nr:alpha-L-fucosidase [Fimbriimonadaceae bacterium]